MDSKPLDQFTFSPFVELFGSFFEKLTSNHPHRDPLRHELSEFKCILYTSQKDSSKIDAYLNSLTNKAIIPLQKPGNATATTKTPEMQKTASNSNTNNDGSSNRPSFNFIKKVEILLISDFLKYRSVGKADKKQTLSTRYTHVQSLEKNPNNFYKTVAIYVFTLIMKSSGLDRMLSEIVDEVAAKRIELASPSENLTHDEMCGVFCGFFSQLIRMKRLQQPTITILETFHDMVGSDRVFGTALASFVKSKIYSFIEQEKFPYELISLKAHVQSKGFKEKVENNDNSQLDTVLRLIPFIFQKDVVFHVFENGTLSEGIYRAPKPKGVVEQLLINENNDLNTIYLLIEKVFLTVTVFGLFTVASSPFIDQSRPSVKTTVSVNSMQTKEAHSRIPSQTISPYTTKRIDPKILKLPLDTLRANSQGQDYSQPSSNSYSNRESMRDVEHNKYTVPSARLSYNSYRTGAMNSDRASYQPKYYGNTYANTDRESSTYNRELYSDRDDGGRKDTLSSNPQDASTRNSYLSSNWNNYAANSINASLTERSNGADTANKSYYPRSTHGKTASYSHFKLAHDQPRTMTAVPQRNSLNPESSQYAKATEAGKGYSQYTYPRQVEARAYTERTSSGGSTNTAYPSTRQDNTHQATPVKTVSVPIEKLDSKSTKSTSSCSPALSTSPTYPNTSPTMEKLKTIVSPRTMTQLPTSTTAPSNNSSTTYIRPSYQYTSKYAASISNKYQSSTSTVRVDGDAQAKPEKKYQINGNYSYQRPSSGAMTDRTSYETSTYRPYTCYNPSSFRLRDMSKAETNHDPRSNVSGSGMQLTTLSTNSSINNNVHVYANQIAQQMQLL